MAEPYCSGLPEWGLRRGLLAELAVLRRLITWIFSKLLQKTGLGWGVFAWGRQFDAMTEPFRFYALAFPQFLGGFRAA